MGRTALVTGAGKGIGKAISLALAHKGIRLVLVSRTAADLEQLAATIRQQGGQALALPCDVTQPDAVAAVVQDAAKALDRVDILVNNAGTVETRKFLNHDDQVWHRMLNANLNSAYYCSKAVVPMMMENKWGRIINIASTASKVGGKYLAAYTASKHGVLGLTRALAVELLPYNITVNAICPGYANTPMTERSVANIVAKTRLSDSDALAVLAKTCPQNRLIQPEEVAAVAVMLVDENARGITGQAINVDGGLVMF